jgi:hypothetical protein
MNFRATILRNGKTATGIEVPADVVDALGAGKKPAVSVTLGSYTYRSTVATMGGKFMLPVSAEVREKAGVAAGQEVDVNLELDTAPRELLVPADFDAALDANPVARAFFDGLSYSNRRRFTLQVDDAKTPETRARRIEKFVGQLGERKV